MDSFQYQQKIRKMIEMIKFVFQSDNVETIEGILIDDIISVVLPRDWKRKKNIFLKLIEHEFIHLAILGLEGNEISKRFDFVYQNIKIFNLES